MTTSGRTGTPTGGSPELDGPPDVPRFLYLECMETNMTIQQAIETAYKRGYRTAAKGAGDGPTVAESYSMLAHAALSDLWMDSDVHEDGRGCCHECCAPCSALAQLDRIGLLDEVLAAWPVGSQGSEMFPDGKLDRVWMYRQWSGSKVQEQCGHRWSG